MPVLVLALHTLSLHAQELRSIKGSVMDGQSALENVEISIQGDNRRTISDVNGKYEIRAATGEVLEYRYAGMKTYIVPVEDVTRYLNLVMVPDITELEEVTVTSSRRRSQEQLRMEYRVNPKLIHTFFGVIDTERAYGRVQMLSEEDIKPIGICILDVIRNRFSGVRTIGNCATGGDVVFRGVGSIGNPRVAIYDVDGQIFRDAPIWLDVTLIRRMALISSVAYTARYGALGGGGVVVINTVNGFKSDPKFRDLARLRNNYIEEPALEKADLQAAKPGYLVALEESQSQEEARSVFDQFESRYSTSPYFFLDAYRYFSDRAGGRDFADEILQKGNTMLENNAVLLKALAYTYEEQGRYEEALEQFKEIFILRPHYSQSYRDLALAYRRAGKAAKAAAMFARYQYLVDIGFLEKSEEFANIIQHESDNLLQLEADAVGTDARKIQTDLFVQESTRLVFEWNDSNAEFELQFVNPEGQYYTWKHTYADNSEQLLDEKQVRYSVSEHILDRSLPGLWKVNLKYHGNKSLTPTYLKATVYSNYGTSQQRSETHVFRLWVKDVNRELFTVSNAVIRQ